jgi:hypothetical protein
MAMAMQQRQWQRSNSNGGAATAMAMAAQQWGWQWWWLRSDGGTAMVEAAQRWWWTAIEEYHRIVSYSVFVNKLISYVAFYVGLIQTGFLRGFQKNYKEL